MVVYDYRTTEGLFSSRDPTHLLSGREFVACKLPRCSSMCVSSVKTSLTEVKNDEKKKPSPIKVLAVAYNSRSFT